ncbi:MAG: DUF362 domain-containing protein [Candidatus Riflebacteria bacterium]|nr:DUF362 domain-containing protein [Candidatus Riflebacteria bacterium]
MNRRDFIKWTIGGVMAGALGTGIGILFKKICPVTILSVSDSEKDIVKELIQIMKDDEIVLNQKKVIIKPNFVEYHHGRPINTDVSLIGQVAEACFKMGALSVAVGEAAGHRRDPSYSVFNPALRAKLNKKVSLLDLNHCSGVKIKNMGDLTDFKFWNIAEPIANADFVINMPKMKTHHWAGVTLSLKNYFGVLPGAFYGWPKNPLHFAGIENSIADLARSIQPNYVIVDGIIGMEGDGPIMGDPKKVGAVVMGKFPLAVDSICSRLMGFDPYLLPSLKQTGWYLPGLNLKNIQLRGENPFQFSQSFSCLPVFDFAKKKADWS